MDWEATGFEFCGEAPDGEMALPLMEEFKPDVLITDIKTPFMNGLQLRKIVREHMPWVKIIILSGHNEFEYAQSAVKLGVTEYLLKPVSAQDLHQVLESLSATLDQEKQEREKLKSLQTKVEDNLVCKPREIFAETGDGWRFFSRSNRTKTAIWAGNPCAILSRCFDPGRII